MEKVYVVTQGCYSDYRIVAIFSTREGAEQFAPAAKSDPKGVRNDTEIVEWDLAEESAARLTAEEAGQPARRRAAACLRCRDAT